jgi:hypothetical protein
MVAEACMDSWLLAECCTVDDSVRSLDIDENIVKSLSNNTVRPVFILIRKMTLFFWIKLYIPTAKVDDIK